MQSGFRFHLCCLPAAGVVHLVDTVIMPGQVAARAAKWSASKPALPNLVQLAESVPTLSTLVKVVVAAGLVNTLESTGPFTGGWFLASAKQSARRLSRDLFTGCVHATGCVEPQCYVFALAPVAAVFAPTDDAFSRLPPGVLDYLLNNTADLTQVLTYHVLSGAVQANQVVDGESVPTVEGANITFHVFGGGRTIIVNDFAKVIAADNEASNGVAHIIDEVLLPEAPRSRAAVAMAHSA